MRPDDNTPVSVESQADNVEVKSLQERASDLAKQGQNWSFASQSTLFKKPTPLFDTPMEITVEQLRGLRMVDETVVVYGKPNQKTLNNGG